LPINIQNRYHYQWIVKMLLLKVTLLYDKK
jgi:hypothetical protein